MSEANLTDWADEAFDAMSTDELRELATKALSGYQRETTVASFSMDAARMFATAGAAGKIETFVDTVKRMYRDRDPRVSTRYSGSVEIVVWQDDDTLRDALKYTRRRAIEQAGAEDAEAA